MRQRTALVITASAVFLAPAVRAQVPPPPPSNDQNAVVNTLISAIQNKDIARYSALLADDVQVYEDGSKVALDKSRWLASFGKSLTANGVIYSIKSAYPSNGKLLTIEYFNSAASFGTGLPAHCCWQYSAVSYSFANGKIAAIHRLDGGSQDIMANLASKGINNAH